MIADWLIKLFDATGFLTRNHCGPWSKPLIIVYVTSNILITLAYLLIPLGLVTIWRQRRHDFNYSWLLILFAAFISSCGLTHVCDVLVFWWPGYRFFTLVSATTALLSVFTALWIPLVTRSLARLPTLATFQAINAELERASDLKEAAIHESRATISALRRQVDHLERMRKTGLWVAEQESALRDLKVVLDSPLVKEAPQ